MYYKLINLYCPEIRTVFEKFAREHRMKPADLTDKDLLKIQQTKWTYRQVHLSSMKQEVLSFSEKKAEMDSRATPY